MGHGELNLKGSEGPAGSVEDEPRKVPLSVTVKEEVKVALVRIAGGYRPAISLSSLVDYALQQWVEQWRADQRDLEDTGTEG